MYWQIILLLCGLAALFVLWPLVQLPFLHKSWQRRASQDETQVTLYYEHLADLDKSLAVGDIDAAQYDALKVELQKALVEDEVATTDTVLSRSGKTVVLVAALVVPMLGVLAYLELGGKPDWEIYQTLQALPKAESREDYEAKLRVLVLEAQARLTHTPDNFALRNLLAQSSMALQDYDEAVVNYRAILDEFPESPRIIANLAQALFYRAGNTVTPEVRDYTQKALALAPMLPEMLGLAGIDAKNQGDYRAAIAYWRRAVSQLAPNSPEAKGYLNGIQKAEAALLAAGESLDEPEVADTNAAAPGFTVEVSLGDKVQVDPATTVFVYARAWQGPKVPLAIQRLTVADLPKSIRLDESMAMAPGMTISAFDQLELVARVSLSGTPAPKSGDWQASMGPITLTEITAPVPLTINEFVP